MDNNLRLEVLRTVLESRTVVSFAVGALLLVLHRTGVELVWIGVDWTYVVRLVTVACYVAVVLTSEAPSDKRDVRSRLELQPS